MALCYPDPVATHSQVLTQPALFQNALDALHVHIGVDERRPTLLKVEGKDVDLRLLYADVTGRGGLQSVISRKEWPMVCCDFDHSLGDFSYGRTPYLVKRIYVKTLHHFEQLYFHQQQGAPLAPVPR